MAIVKLAKDGYGQLELNQVAFRRDGRIEAQCALDKDDFAEVPAENGMLLAVNNVARTVAFPEDGGNFPIALHYSTEHIYDERTPGLKNWALKRGSFLPRLGYLAVGDKFTTNTVCYDDGDFANEDALVEALAKDAMTAAPVYGGVCVDNGYIKVSKTAPTEGPVLMAILKTTMPDGQLGIKFQVIE